MSVFDNLGPLAYCVDEIVKVRLQPAPHVLPTWYSARVVRRSTTHLHLCVAGSGNEIALSSYNTKALVRRVPR